MQEKYLSIVMIIGLSSCVASNSNKSVSNPGRKPVQSSDVQEQAQAELKKAVVQLNLNGLLVVSQDDFLRLSQMQQQLPDASQDTQNFNLLNRTNKNNQNRRRPQTTDERSTSIDNTTDEMQAIEDKAERADVGASKHDAELQYFETAITQLRTKRDEFQNKVQTNNPLGAEATQTSELALLKIAKEKGHEAQFNSILESLRAGRETYANILTFGREGVRIEPNLEFAAEHYQKAKDNALRKLQKLEHDHAKIQLKLGDVYKAIDKEQKEAGQAVTSKLVSLQKKRAGLEKSLLNNYENVIKKAEKRMKYLNDSLKKFDDQLTKLKEKWDELASTLAELQVEQYIEEAEQQLTSQGHQIIVVDKQLPATPQFSAYSPNAFAITYAQAGGDPQKPVTVIYDFEQGYAVDSQEEASAATIDADAVELQSTNDEVDQELESSGSQVDLQE